MTGVSIDTIQHGADQLIAQLCVPMDAGTGAGPAAAHRWLESGFARLGHELRDRIRAAQAAGLPLGLDRSQAEPGRVVARCTATVRPGDGNWHGDAEDEQWTAAFSDQSWNLMLGRLQAGASLSGVDIHTWRPSPGGSGMLIGGQPSLVIMATTSEQGDQSWMRLSAMGSERMLAGTPRRQHDLVEFYRGVAEECGPVAGEIFVGQDALSSPLEAGTRRRAGSLYESRRIIRGYSWITIIAEEVGRRLGGVKALLATGAFHEVVHLARGGYLLQATEAFADYRMPQAHKVFHALAPALPPGVPLAGREREMIVLEDPADAESCDLPR